MPTSPGLALAIRACGSTSSTETISGELSFCAGWNKDDVQLYIEDRETDAGLRAMDSFICDVFEIAIRC